MTTTPAIGALQEVDAYSQPRIPAHDTPLQAEPLRRAQRPQHSHTWQYLVQSTPPALPRSAADKSQSSLAGWLAAYEPANIKGGWLPDALRALAEVDEEIVEDGLPEVSASAKNEAERIIRRLAWQPCAPTVYPTRDAEIAIHFKSPDAPNSVVILLNNHGQGECYAYTGGNSRRAHYDTSSDLPDDFVLQQLRALTQGPMAASAARAGFGASDMLWVAGTLAAWQRSIAG